MKWTPEEMAVISAALDEEMSPEHGYAAELAKKLPRRNTQDVRNIFNIERKRRLGLCPCGRLKPLPGRAQCIECKERKDRRRREALLRGDCVYCLKPIDANGTTTTCSTCVQARRARTQRSDQRQGADNWRKMVQAGKVERPRGYNLLHWIGCRNTRGILRNVTQGDLLVDLFGGSGDMLLRAAGQGHEALAYNDAHPMLVSFIRTLQAGKVKELCQRIRVVGKTRPEMLGPLYKASFQEAARWVQDHRLHPTTNPDEWEEEIGRAALLYVMSHSVEGKKLPQGKVGEVRVKPVVGHKKRMWEAHKFLADVETTCLDFPEAITWHDCEKTVFLCDPPWPNADCYEHHINGRHEELVNALMAARGRFVLVMSAAKESLVAMRRVPYVYWMPSIGGSKLILGSDFPLAGVTPIEREQFGYLA